MITKNIKLSIVYQHNRPIHLENCLGRFILVKKIVKILNLKFVFLTMGQNII